MHISSVNKRLGVIVAEVNKPTYDNSLETVRVQVVKCHLFRI